MQEKINRTSLILSTIQVVCFVGSLLYLLIFQIDFVKSNILLVFGLPIILFLVTSYLIRYYEYHADKDFILKAASNNEIALLRINRGTYQRTIKDSFLKKYNLWKIEGTMYDKNFNAKNITFIDKFASSQTEIPLGYCYITDSKDEHLMIVNNIIGANYNLQKDVEAYENKIKNIKYLNVYYNDGLKVETMKDMLKKQESDEKFRKELEKNEIRI